MITMSERDTFVAAHVTPQTKDALKCEADIRKISVSALIAQFLVAKLEEGGYDLSKPFLDLEETEEAVTQTEA